MVAMVVFPVFVPPSQTIDSGESSKGRCLVYGCGSVKWIASFTRHPGVSSITTVLSPSFTVADRAVRC